jgi:hypothetical protein
MVDAYNKYWFELSNLNFAVAAGLQLAALQMHTTRVGLNFELSTLH